MSGTLTSSHHLGNDYFCTLQFPGLSYSVFLLWERGDSNYLVVTIKKISHTCTWSWQCSVHILYTHIHMCTIPASKARNCCMKSIRSRIMPSICNDPLNKKVACTNVVPVAQYYTHYLASSVIVRLCFGFFYCCLHRVFSHFLHHLFVSTCAINCSEICVLTCLYYSNKRINIPFSVDSHLCKLTHLDVMLRQNARTSECMHQPMISQS